MGGATAKGADKGALTSIIELLNSSQGGADGILGKLKQGGLGDIVDSWIGTGKNKAVKSNQISNALGSEQGEQIAGKLGISKDEAAKKLAQYLPTIIDKVTPNGNASSLNKNIDIKEILGGFLK